MLDVRLEFKTQNEKAAEVGRKGNSAPRLPRPRSFQPRERMPCGTEQTQLENIQHQGVFDVIEFSVACVAVMVQNH